MKIRLFGAFRNLQADPEMALDIPSNVKTIGDLRQLLANHFRETKQSFDSGTKQSFDAVGLLEKSAIANETVVLQDTALFASDDRLALLPPVSGG